MKTYTIITGASKGIGKAFAFECAAKKMNLILVARSAELLTKLADELSATGVEVKTIAVDLLEPKAADKIFDRIKSEQWNVNMLINNAGIGDHGAFAKQSLQHQLNTMQLNMNVMVEMAYHFLHNSDNTQKRYILNTASTGAFQPVPNFSIYTATKAFILSFTESLHFEMKQQQVHVTALCPGGTETEFFSGSENMQKVVKKNQAYMMPAKDVALQGLEGLLRNKTIVIPGLVNKVGAVAAQLMPRKMVVSTAAKFFDIKE
jgi:hypothetical protein